MNCLFRLCRILAQGAVAAIIDTIAKVPQKNKINGVGIDHYSIGGIRDSINPVVHTILLEAGVWIVEELCFPSEAFGLPQPCKFWSLPVNLKGHTGAFCHPVIEA